MNIPSEPLERERLQRAVRRLMNDAAMPGDFSTVFMGWMEGELAKRDVANRIIGHENKVSEAQALAAIVNLCAECRGGTDEMPRT